MKLLARSYQIDDTLGVILVLRAFSVEQETLAGLRGMRSICVS